MNQLPPILAQNNNSEPSAREVLLIWETRIGSQKDIESRLFGCANQFTIQHPIPTLFSRSPDVVFLQNLPDSDGSALIKQNEH